MKNRFNPILASLIVIGSAATAQAAVYDWKGLATGVTGGVSETWDTVTANWTGTGTTWPTTGADNDATFGGTAGTVTISGGVTANDLTFNTTGYQISGGTLTLVINGTTAPLINTPTGVGTTISSVLAGTSGFTKTGADSTGVLTLSASNTLSGAVNINSGALRLTNSNALGTSSKTVYLNGGGGIAAGLELRLDPGVSGSITLPSAIGFSTATNSGAGIRNKSGNNEIKGNINVRSGLGSTSIGSDAGSLTMSGTISAGATGRVLYLNGNSTSPNIVKGAINNGSGLALNKGGAGIWVLSGNNTFANGTTVASGNLIVTSATGLGTGATANVSVALGASLNYVAKTDATLAIGNNLTITGGLNTAIGASIGAEPTIPSINVSGAATISDAAHLVNLYGIPGVTATGGSYILVKGGTGSALKPATVTPTLGKVYNNSSFTVGDFSATDTTLEVAITAVPALENAYWTGGLAGGDNVWALSNGKTASNWADSGGSVQAIVPGSTTNVVISTTLPVLVPIATVLGADMTIDRLTISDITNNFGLNADGYTLTLAPLLSADGITVAEGAKASTIAAKVELGAAQTWTNNNLVGDLTVSGIISGANSLTKKGAGKVVLAGNNTYSGDTQVIAGTLGLASVKALAGSTLTRDVADTGVLTFDVVGDNTYSIGGLSGAGSLDAGGKTLSIGGNNASTEYSGILSNGSLTKVGTGALTLSGNNTFTGNVIISAGRLTLAHSKALGLADPNPPFNGRKGLIMQGTGRSLGLTGGITIPANFDFFVSSGSNDGEGIENVSGNNEIKAQINFSVGNPGLNIASSADTLTISGNITMTQTARTLYLSGDSANDNTISGDITESTAAIMPVIKRGAGKWIFSGTNTYKGDTTVNDGTLVLASGGSTRFLPKADGTSNKITGNGTGTLTLNGALDINLTAAASAPDNTAWLLVDVTNVIETYDTNFKVTGFDETAAGTWKKGVGLDLYTFTELDGKLTLAAGANTYQKWIDTKSPATGFATDSDNDGIANGLENVFGTDPNAYSAGLTDISSTANSATYQHPLSSVVAGDINYTYEWSTDLVEWKLTNETNTAGTKATITPSAPASGVVTVVTTITEGPAAKLFTRLKVTKP